MEQLAQNILPTFIGGILISFLSNAIRNRVSYNNARVILLGVSILVGILYQIFELFLPQELKQNIIQFVVMSLTTAVFVYEYVWKFVREQIYPDHTKNNDKEVLDKPLL